MLFTENDLLMVFLQPGIFCLPAKLRRWKVEKLGMKISTSYFARSMRGNDVDSSRKRFVYQD